MGDRGFVNVKRNSDLGFRNFKKREKTLRSPRLSGKIISGHRIIFHRRGAEDEEGWPRRSGALQNEGTWI